MRTPKHAPLRTIAALCGLLLTTAAVSAQSRESQGQPPPQPQQQRQDPSRMPRDLAKLGVPLEAKPFRIQNTDVGDIAELLQRSIDDALVTIDSRTNTAFIVGSEDAVRKAGELIARLDVPMEPLQLDQAVKIFKIEHADIDKVAATVINVFNPRRGSGPMPNEWAMVSVDANSRSLIVRSTAAGLEAVGALIGQLDVTPTTSAQPVEISVRLVWLVSGLDAARTVPGDLKDVVTELSAAGIDGLGLAAQSIVRVRTDQQFKTRFTADLDKPWMMEVSCFAEAGGNHRALKLGIEGRATEGPEHASLETTITTVSGHFVVLGATPIGSRDSVFVIQATDIK